jgi:hypothetical protein
MGYLINLYVGYGRKLYHFIADKTSLVASVIEETQQDTTRCNNG